MEAARHSHLTFSRGIIFRERRACMKTTCERIRQPAVAGTFYSSTEAALRKELEGFFSTLTERTAGGKIHGIIVPHAGYVYSGATAAHAYGLLRGKTYDAVVVVGPSHREFFDKISIYPGEAFSTPLGMVPIQQELREELLHFSPEFIASTIGHRTEHSIETDSFPANCSEKYSNSSCYHRQPIGFFMHSFGKSPGTDRQRT